MTDREAIESMLYELATPQKMGSFFVFKGKFLIKEFLKT